jgi:hypothetical protein
MGRCPLWHNRYYYYRRSDNNCQCSSYPAFFSGDKGRGHNPRKVPYHLPTPPMPFGIRSDDSVCPMPPDISSGGYGLRIPKGIGESTRSVGLHRRASGQPPKNPPFHQRRTSIKGDFLSFHTVCCRGQDLSSLPYNLGRCRDKVTPPLQFPDISSGASGQ